MNLIPLEKSQEILVIWDVVHTASAMIHQGVAFRGLGSKDAAVVGSLVEAAL